MVNPALYTSRTQELARQLRARSAVALLPAAQVAVLGISTVTFAVLARLLGPRAFGEFASVAFVFSVSSLVADFAPQAFLLVRGVSPENYSTARVSAAVSWCFSCLMLLAGLGTYSWFAEESDTGTLFVTVALAVGLASQFAMQLPRALLTAARRYGALAVVDVAGTLIVCVLAVAVGYAGGLPDVDVLVLQLSSTLLVRQIGAQVAARYFGLVPTVNATRSRLERAKVGLAFGRKVIPLNVGSFMSRSLDSGLMSFFLGASLAGVYARSYQLVVAPMSQIQLSLGPFVLNRFGTLKNQQLTPRHPAYRNIWLAILGATAVIGTLISLASGVLADIVFGPGWPHASLMITGMAATLPALSSSTYLAWVTQVFPRPWVSVGHLFLVLIAPCSALVGARTGGFEGALVSLVVCGGLLQPLLLSWLHREILPLPHLRVMCLLASQWMIPAVLFFWALER